MTDRGPLGSVDQAGITLPPTDAQWFDVLFDGRRIWSFRHPAPDQPGRSHLVPWPKDLRGFLDGVVEVVVRGPDGAPCVSQEARFGTSTERVAVVDPSGVPLVFGPNQRLVVPFEARDAADLLPLVEAVEQVLGILNGAGVDAFPAYGTLLGAVRDGRLIGHDDDADVSYLSRHDHPADVIRESFRLQRLLHRSGLRTSRYSAGAFKVLVRHGDGETRSLDVFAGFLHEGNLAMLGEIYEPFERSWLVPLSSCTLEGIELPAPAYPERLLSVMYGPSWRTPDPTWSFDTPAEVHARFDTWFRGTRTYRNDWDRRYSAARRYGPRRDPHQLARLVHEREPDATLVDLGCGRGQDAVWWARRGHEVVALDFSPSGSEHLAGRARAEGWSVEFDQLNLLELRQTLAWGARLARISGPRAIMARHLLDATTPRGRRHLLRLARMTLRDGGRLYLEFLALRPGRAQTRLRDPLVRNLDPATVEAEIEEAGGRVVWSETVEQGAEERPSELEEGSPAPLSRRMVVEWAG